MAIEKERFPQRVRGIGPELNSRWAVDDDRRTRVVHVGCFLGISNSEIYLGARPCLTL